MRRFKLPGNAHSSDTAQPLPGLGRVALLDVSHSTSDNDETLVSEQLLQLSRTTPILLLAHLIGGGGLVFTLFASGDMPLAFVGLGLVAATLFIDALFASLSRLDSIRQRPPYIGARLAMAYGALVGISWSALLLIGVPTGTTGAQAALGVAFIGTGTVAALVMAAVPIVLIVHWVILVCAMAFSFGSSTVALTLSGICFCVAAVAVGQARRRLVASRQRYREDREGRTARLLLAEFEHGGKAWLWETSADGRITYISEPLAQMLAGPGNTPVGTPLTDLIISENPQDLDTASGERTLGFHLSARLPFSDLMVHAKAPEAARWWSLSGRPAYDEYRRFTGFRGVGADLTEMGRSEVETNRLARHDALTGLPNRVVMRQTLDQAVRGATNRPDPCALFLLDLDRFKAVNDTLGHPIGDALLRQVAERLLHEVGKDGRVGRLGGDEFNIILPGIINREPLAALAERVIDSVSQPYTIEGSLISIGASIGIAIAPRDGDCADLLVRNADLALYAAKAAGKGVHRFYESIMRADAKDKRLLEADLRHVLRDNGLHLVYQPVVSARNEQIVGFEALIRWNHPVRGLVAPSIFIPLAEEMGLMPAIGEWVIRTACLEAAQWPDPIRIAINLSPLQFANPALPTLVMNALATANLPPHRLELETTESVFLNDPAATDEMFNRLVSLGVRLSLDDFGIGYASLGYLRKAPFHKIKIDQTFVRGAALPGNRNAAIIKAIVALAESFGMETTAEGAESQDEVALIRALGCSQIQGYIFGKPIPANDVRHLLRRSVSIDPHERAISRESRTAILRTAILHHDDRDIDVRIRNISAGGIMAESDHMPPDDSRVEVEFAEGPRVFGEVRWARNGRFGIKFDNLFRLNELRLPRPRKTDTNRAVDEAGRKGRRTGSSRR